MNDEEYIDRIEQACRLLLRMTPEQRAEVKAELQRILNDDSDGKTVKSEYTPTGKICC